VEEVEIRSSYRDRCVLYEPIDERSVHPYILVIRAKERRKMHGQRMKPPGAFRKRPPTRAPPVVEQPTVVCVCIATGSDAGF
jgi:hypothetical protein